eukprot:9064871-Prorocentrum_lima.AAC.1
MLYYSVSPKITEARALYRPGDDPSVESQAPTHKMVMLRDSTGPRRPCRKRPRWPEEPPEDPEVPVEPGN